VVVKVLATMPGRYGDILWSLPTVRALAERHGEPVDFATSATHAQVIEIVGQQDYIGTAFAIEAWKVVEGAPITPRLPYDCHPEGYHHAYHLGYDQWPMKPLAFEVAERFAGVTVEMPGFLRPWIKVAPGPPRVCPLKLAIGWTDEWFELKGGLMVLLSNALYDAGIKVTTKSCPAPGSRWTTEVDGEGLSLLEAAQTIQDASLFLGDLSALAVIAAGMGKPRVLVEPQPARHHEIFQHWDTELVIGSDGKPTFDARHVADAVKKKLEEVGTNTKDCNDA
jgi:hypothetical protein